MPNQQHHHLSEHLRYKLPKIRLCLVRENTHDDDVYVVQTPQDVASLLQPLRHHSEEHFVSVHLNARNEVIGLHEISHGTLSASLVHPREVFKAAILANSHAIIVCHNHPSGSALSPSKEDLDTTDQLLKAGKLLGINVLDHLIIGPIHDVFSLREHHPALWE